MDSNTGKLYSSHKEALSDGIANDDIVFIKGAPKTVQRVSKAVKTYGKKRNKRLNAPEFNRKANIRRDKAKQAKKFKKRNRRK